MPSLPPPKNFMGENMLKQIKVISPAGEKLIEAETGTLLADALCAGGFTVPAACGRRGTCGKCSVRLINGSFGNEEAKNGMIRSCRAVICENAEIGVDFVSGGGLTDFSAEAKIKKDACGIAADIGTTTVAASLIKKDGTVVSRSRLNPQSAFGADVISRIEACGKGALGELTRLIRTCIAGLINELDPGKEAGELVVSGNATMLHLFCGVSPESMGVSPFTPQFTDALFLSGKELGLPIDKVTVLPSVSAFVGSDIVAGIYALGLHRAENRALLADLGTNGELVLSDRGRLFCTSTAAGPALEGACIECGAGGVPGAIDRVFSENGKLCFSTVGGAAPVGICGAGLTDAVALLLKENTLDESGYLENELRICENVYVSQQDIRQFQLAKSAVFSGIETLTEEVGIEAGQIDRLYIAGGLGYYINPESAFISGLLPRVADVKPAGNTSLQGALMCMGCPEAVEEMRKISRSCTLVDLGGNPEFGNRFMNNMFFT